MKFISHRGNINGVDIEKENTVKAIIAAINQGFDVETDIWFIDGRFYLGHDRPQYEISLFFLQIHSDTLWCHAKDIITLNILLKYPELNCFFHQNDDCTLTSKGQIWTYFNKPLTNSSILLKFEKDENFIIPENIFGVCSDNIEFYRNMIK